MLNGMRTCNLITPTYIVTFVICNRECEINMILGIIHNDRRNKILRFNIASVIKVQYGQIQKIYEHTNTSNMFLMSVNW